MASRSGPVCTRSQRAAECTLPGRAITLNGRPFRVIGITDSSFTYFGDTNRLFLLLTYRPEQAANNGGHDLQVIARRRAGVSFEQADQRVAAIAGPAQELDDHGADENRALFLQSLYEATVGEVRGQLLMVMGAVVLLVLIACANVANLEIAHGIARRREIALRLALGAGPGRIARQLLTESVLLGLLGGVAGMVLAFLSMSSLQSMIATSLPRADNIELDLGVFAFALALSLLSGALAGVAPAYLVSRRQPVEPIKEASSTMAGSGGATWLRKGFLVVQVSLALTLAVGAVLLLRTFGALSAVDMGFDPDGVMVGGLSLGGHPEYRDHSLRLEFLAKLEARISSHPDIESVGATNFSPGAGIMITEEFVVDDPGEAEPFSAQMRVADPGFFSALDIRPLEGRVLTAEDNRAGAAPVALVDEPLARRYGTVEDAIGKRLRIAAGTNDEWLTVVGVVPGMRIHPLQSEMVPSVYVPSRRHSMPYPWLIVRGTAGSAAVAEWTRLVVNELDEGIPVPDMSALADTVANRIVGQRLNSILLTIFAAVALSLAAVGEYAVIQCAVRQRTSEIGIRMALGARAAEVVAMVLRQGLALVLTGVVVGLTAAWSASRLLESMLFGVERTDPLTYAATALFLIIVAVVASSLPAWHAGRVDPVIALRNQG